MMSQTPPQQGIVAALWTPLTISGGVDAAALERHLGFLLSSRVSGLLVVGSTGRFVDLTPEQREDVIRLVLSRTNRLPVVANISDLDPRVVKRLGAVASDHGAAAAAVLPPWYYAMSQSDLIEWFVAAGEAARLPLWLYNYPDRTGNPIELATTREVMSRTQVAGFKHSGSDRGFIEDLVRMKGDTPLAVFAGTDSQIAESLEAGAVGCVSGLANALPDVSVTVFEALRAGDPNAVVPQQALLSAVAKRFHLVPFPWNHAAVMTARGIDPGELPGYLSRITRAHFEQLARESRSLMEAYGVPRVS